MKKHYKIVILVTLLYTVFNINISALTRSCEIYNSDNEFVRQCENDFTDIENLDDGQYFIRSTVTNSLGNTTVTDSNLFFVDKTRPELFFSSLGFIIRFDIADNMDNNPSITIRLNGEEFYTTVIDLSEYIGHEIVFNIDGNDEAQNFTNAHINLRVTETGIEILSYQNIQRKGLVTWQEFIGEDGLSIVEYKFSITNSLTLKVASALIMLIPIILIVVSTRNTDRMIDDVLGTLFTKKDELQDDHL